MNRTSGARFPQIASDGMMKKSSGSGYGKTSRAKTEMSQPLISFGGTESSRLFINHLSPNRNFQLYQESKFQTTGTQLTYNSDNFEIHVKNKVLSKLLNYFAKLKKELDYANELIQRIELGNLIIGKACVFMPARRVDNIKTTHNNYF